MVAAKKDCATRILNLDQSVEHALHVGTPVHVVPREDQRIGVPCRDELQQLVQRVEIPVQVSDGKVRHP
jgi:hypothetical protein